MVEQNAKILGIVCRARVRVEFPSEECANPKDRICDPGRKRRNYNYSYAVPGFHFLPNVSDHRTREPKANEGSVCRRCWETVSLFSSGLSRVSGQPDRSVRCCACLTGQFILREVWKRSHAETRRPEGKKRCFLILGLRVLACANSPCVRQSVARLVVFTSHEMWIRFSNTPSSPSSIHLS